MLKGKNKTEESNNKKSTGSPGKSGNGKENWAVKEVGQEEEEEWRDPCWFYLDINGASINTFLIVRETVVEKALC